MKVLFAVLLTGCATAPKPRPFCVTPCGVSVVARAGPPVYSCDDYWRVEAALVAQTRELPTCQMLNGYTAEEVPGEKSMLDGGYVIGWTICWLKQIYIHTAEGLAVDDNPWIRRRLWHTALAHEMVHAAQDCKPPLPVDPGLQFQHSNWNRDGLFRAIEKANLAAQLSAKQ